LVERENERIWVKSMELVEEGQELHNGKVLRRFEKEGFRINLLEPDPLEIEAMGEFMCGCTLHGQWLAELVAIVLVLNREKVHV